MHIHILGAPGAGVTTLGKTLAMRLGFKDFDVDNYYWFTDDALPYRRKRNPEHRRVLLEGDLRPINDWVLSGSLCGWGDVFVPQFNFVVYLWLPVGTRLERIRARETLRYGAGRLDPGGDLHFVYEKFLHWAAGYDEPLGNIRSRERELAWLAGLSCPVLRVETEMGVEELMELVIAAIQDPRPTAFRRPTGK